MIRSVARHSGRLTQYYCSTLRTTTRDALATHQYLKYYPLLYVLQYYHHSSYAARRTHSTSTAGSTPTTVLQHQEQLRSSYQQWQRSYHSTLCVVQYQIVLRTSSYWLRPPCCLPLCYCTYYYHHAPRPLLQAVRTRVVCGRA